MRGLTLQQPWAHAIAAHGKDVVNRTWRAPRHVLGQRIAIHAGKVISIAGLDVLASLGHAVPQEDLVLGAVVATAELYEVTRTAPSRWAERGFWHWRLRDVRALAHPVRCRGGQGLWPVDPLIVDLIARAEAAGVTK